MVYKKLSEKDKIIIKYLQQKLGYGAKRIIKGHPEKNWGLRNVGYLLKKKKPRSIAHSSFIGNFTYLLMLEIFSIFN